MKKIVSFFTVMAIVTMFMAPVLLKAEDNKETVSGKVQVEKNKAGKIIKITIIKEEKDEDGEKETTIYSVQLDKTGLALAKHKNQQVSVVGIVDDEEIDNDFVLSVKVLEVKAPADNKK